MSSASESKPARLNIRVSEHEKDVLTRAAEALRTTVSKFVLQRTYAEAQTVLAEQNHFQLSQRQWKQFCRALDVPPKDLTALRKLLTQPGVFDA